ncbi:hypothetical protein [Bacillus sp. 03113]|uniref:hypothetical protein n=1 Tax=Bacillus sp. 03113 TaxID=2578211 RepID=UPI0015E8DE1C|nr:hypothetical protein [Bacillus sp. 03113]
MNLLETLRDQIVKGDWTKYFEGVDIEMEKFDKEALLKFVSDVLDRGGKVSLLDYGFDQDKSVASGRISELSNVVNGSVREVEKDGYAWFNFNSDKVNYSSFYDFKTLEEDVDLTGSDPAEEGEEIA